MEPGHVAPVGGKALGQLFGVGLFREACTAVEISAPEADGGTVFKYEAVALGGQKAVLTCGLFAFEQIGDIDWGEVRVGGEGDVLRHGNLQKQL